MKRLIFIFIASFVVTPDVFAICKGSTFINPITEVRWSCMLPISLGGVSASTVPVPEAALTCTQKAHRASQHLFQVQEQKDFERSPIKFYLPCRIPTSKT